jgi:zinc protease
VVRRALPLLVLLAACAAPPARPVAPLRYEPLPPTPDAPFRASPPIAAPSAPALSVRFQTAALANGLGVVVAERHDLPVVAVALVSARGCWDVGTGQPICEVYEEALADRAGTRPPAPAVAALAALGGVVRASLGSDAATLKARSGVRDLDAAVTALAEQAARPQFGLLLPRNERLTGLTPRSATDLATINVRRLLLGPLPPRGYHRYEATAAAALVEADLPRLHARFFHPAHAVLVAVGDTTLDEVRAIAERRLGSWAPPAPPTPRGSWPAPPSEGHQVAFIAAAAPMVMVVVGALGPGLGAADLPALEVAARILGSSSFALHTEVREQQGATYDFSGGLNRTRTLSALVLGGSFAPDKAAPALRAIRDAFTRLRTTGPSDEEVARAVQSLLAEWREAVSSAEGLAAATAEMIGAGLPPDALGARPAQVLAVTASDVRRAAGRYLTPEALRWAVAAAPSLRADVTALGLGQVSMRDRWGDPE